MKSESFEVAVQMEMMRLEARHGESHDDVALVVAAMLDTEPEETLRALRQEIARAAELWTNWYARAGLSGTVPNVLGLGFLQGITFTLAVRALQSAGYSSSP